MKETIIVQRTAHFYIQKANQHSTSLLIVVHGYAQLGSEFIKEFNLLKTTTTDVLAPEALSKFYNKERKPVANWMTSYERDSEIEDYLHYFKGIEEYVKANFPNHKINVLGFSQGVSTLMRWLSKTSLRINQAHLVAGSIPPELTKESLSKINAKAWFYYHGDADKLLTSKQAEQQIEKIHPPLKDLKIVRFKGRHEIPAEFFKLMDSTD